jgi:hypothetical protein
MEMLEYNLNQNTSTITSDLQSMFLNSQSDYPLPVFYHQISILRYRQSGKTTFREQAPSSALRLAVQRVMNALKEINKESTHENFNWKSEGF